MVNTLSSPPSLSIMRRINLTIFSPYSALARLMD